MTRAPTWRAWLAGSAVAALAGWFVAPEPDQQIALVQARSDRWELAPLPRRSDQTGLAAAVAGAAFWGDAGAPAAVTTPPEDPRWRVAAVYGHGQQLGALIMFAAPNKPPLRLQVGDLLPSGHRISSIGEREICIQIGKQTRRLGVQRIDS